MSQKPSRKPSSRRMQKSVYKTRLPPGRTSSSSVVTSSEDISKNASQKQSSTIMPSTLESSDVPSHAASDNQRSSATLSKDAIPVQSDSPKSQKKKLGFFSFFASKEPSPSTPDEQQRDRSPSKGGKALGTASIMTQKTSPNVSRRNSKRDGFLSTVTLERPTNNKCPKSSPTDSTSWTDSESSHRPPNSPASSNSRSSSSSYDLSPSSSTALKPRKPRRVPRDTASPTSHPGKIIFLTDRVPLPPHASEYISSMESLHDVVASHRATVPPLRQLKPYSNELPPGKKSCLKGSRKEESGAQRSHSSSLSSLTDSEIAINWPDPGKPEIATAVVLSPVAGKPIVRTQTPNRSPKTPNFSRPLSAQSQNQRPVSQPLLVPVFKPGPTQDAPLYGAGEVLQRRRIDSLYDPAYKASSAPSTPNRPVQKSEVDVSRTSTSSAAPSEISETWHKTPQERLGLGGQLRKDENSSTLEELRPDKPKKKGIGLGVFGRSST